MATGNDAEIIADLVLAYKILVNEAVLDSFGHISVRSSVNPDRFLLPRAMPLAGRGRRRARTEHRDQPTGRSARTADQRRALSAWRNLQGAARRERGRAFAFAGRHSVQPDWRADAPGPRAGRFHAADRSQFRNP